MRDILRVFRVAQQSLCKRLPPIDKLFGVAVVSTTLATLLSGCAGIYYTYDRPHHHHRYYDDGFVVAPIIVPPPVIVRRPPPPVVVLPPPVIVRPGPMIVPRGGYPPVYRGPVPHRGDGWGMRGPIHGGPRHHHR